MSTIPPPWLIVAVWAACSMIFYLFWKLECAVQLRDRKEHLMATPPIPKEMADALEEALQGLQRKAADNQDRIALHLLDAIWGFEKNTDPERLALMMLVQARVNGNGQVAGNVTCNALTQLLTLTGFRL